MRMHLLVLGAALLASACDEPNRATATSAPLTEDSLRTILAVELQPVTERLDRIETRLDASDASIAELRAARTQATARPERRAPRRPSHSTGRTNATHTVTREIWIVRDDWDREYPRTIRRSRESFTEVAHEEFCRKKHPH